MSEHAMFRDLKISVRSNRHGFVTGSLIYKGGKPWEFEITPKPWKVRVWQYQRGRNRAGYFTVKTYPMRGDAYDLAYARLRHEFPC